MGICDICREQTRDRVAEWRNTVHEDLESGGDIWANENTAQFSFAMVPNLRDGLYKPRKKQGHHKHKIGKIAGHLSKFNAGSNHVRKSTGVHHVLPQEQEDSEPSLMKHICILCILVPTHRVVPAGKDQ